MSEGDTPALKLDAVIGFGGDVPAGLLLHPLGRHIIYPLGSTVVIRDVVEDKQVFLQGHSNKVSCLALSHDGRMIASGQDTHMGFKADAIVWDFEAAVRNAGTGDRSGELLHRLTLHKVTVASVAFSPNDQHLVTLGGRDDNNIVVWDVATGEPICGAPAANDESRVVTWFNTRDDMLVTGGNYTLRLWEFDRPSRRIRPTDCNLGHLKRIITCIDVDEDDQFVYCGTHTGDVLKVNASNGRFVVTSKNRYVKGVTALRCFSAGRGAHLLAIGTGSGHVGMLKSAGGTFIQELRLAQLSGAVTSVAPNAARTHFFAGTAAGSTYFVSADDLTYELRGTSHVGPVTDVCFPTGCSDIFVTCANEDIRVWNAARRVELLRILVPNLACNCVVVAPNGRSIVSGWSDGKIRAFFPESGRLQYVITDAHQESVTAVAVTNDSQYVISGGKDGRVRKWRIGSAKQDMVASLKEHKAPVTHIAIRSDDQECVSASMDGSCIVWDMVKHIRASAMFASTMFKCVQYHPDESQLVTCGSDRKVTYWDATDGSAIRILDGAESEINALHVDPHGSSFVSCGEDKLVKLWHYDEGYIMGVGTGHSGGVNSVKISPDRTKIVSTGEEGTVFVWSMPDALAGAKSEVAEVAGRMGELRVGGERSRGRVRQGGDRRRH